MDLTNESNRLGKNDMILIYLLMSIDGVVSDNEQKQFYELLEQYGLKNEKNTIVGKAKDVLEQIDSTNLETTELIRTFYGEYKTDRKNYKEVLWSLVNMSFADKELSDNERTFIEVF